MAKRKKKDLPTTNAKRVVVNDGRGPKFYALDIDTGQRIEVYNWTDLLTVLATGAEIRTGDKFASFDLPQKWADIYAAECKGITLKVYSDRAGKSNGWDKGVPKIQGPAGDLEDAKRFRDIWMNTDSIMHCYPARIPWHIVRGPQFEVLLTEPWNPFDERNAVRRAATEIAQAARIVNYGKRTLTAPPGVPIHSDILAYDERIRTIIQRVSGYRPKTDDAFVNEEIDVDRWLMFATLADLVINRGRGYEFFEAVIGYFQFGYPSVWSGYIDSLWLPAYIRSNYREHLTNPSKVMRRITDIVEYKHEYRKIFYKKLRPALRWIFRSVREAKKLDGSHALILGPSRSARLIEAAAVDIGPGRRWLP